VAPIGRRIVDCLTHTNVCSTTHMKKTSNLKTQRVLSGGTPSHQYGYYEMRPQESTGKRRSYFKVLVNLDEHPTLTGPRSLYHSQ